MDQAASFTSAQRQERIKAPSIRREDIINLLIGGLGTLLLADFSHSFLVKPAVREEKRGDTIVMTATHPLPRSFALANTVGLMDQQVVARDISWRALQVLNKGGSEMEQLIQTGEIKIEIKSGLTPSMTIEETLRR